MFGFFLWIFLFKSHKDGVSELPSGRACESEIKTYSANGPPAKDFSPSIRAARAQTLLYAYMHEHRGTTFIMPLAAMSPKAAAQDGEQGREIKASKMELLNLYR